MCKQLADYKQNGGESAAKGRGFTQELIDYSTHIYASFVVGNCSRLDRPLNG